MCRKCIKSDVCHHKFVIGAPIQHILKKKDPPPDMKLEKGVSLQEFEKIMDTVQEHCQYFIEVPEIKTVNITPEGIQ